MKTPDEIKRGLECCTPKWLGNHWKTCDAECPYVFENDFCRNVLNADALAYIRELEARVAELERVKKERDAAIADMEEMQSHICHACKHYYQPDSNIRKWSCRVLGEYWIDICEHEGGMLECSNFEWRGVQEDG